MSKKTANTHKQQEILDLINVVTNKHNNNFVDFKKIGKVEAKTIAELTGLNVEGYVHTLDNSGVLHALKHKNINASDILLIPFIIDNYDFIGKGKEENTIVYKKVINQEYYYVEEIRKGRKKLALKTLYKRKKRVIF
ncbi:PBECR3 domain-containing polyvalent protein [Capnocytophaga canimorsus]|uniref:PBECR3 domain-containing polyvalent protein n=1 Tax=Capnocytophaga canimorsus TaxID=28188 RepID=UPI003858AC80